MVRQMLGDRYLNNERISVWGFKISRGNKLLRIFICLFYHKEAETIETLLAN